MSNKIITSLEYRRPRLLTIEEVASSVYPGWHDLIESMLNDMFDAGWDGELLQIKEKFGTLRVYLNGSSDEVHARIAQAEHESGVTCRECGQPGEMDGDGWLKVSCIKHATTNQ